MKFAVPDWLFGSGLAVLVAIALIVGGVLASRNVKRFGDEALVHGLLTANPRGRRALKGVLLVLAVGLAFLLLPGVLLLAADAALRSLVLRRFP